MAEIEITIRQESDSRIVMGLAGETVFLEANIPIAARIEAALSAAFLPALAARATLLVSEPADRVFLRNLEEIACVAGDRWGWHNPEPVRCAENNCAPPAAAAASAMFFTGGVDSFCTLLRNQGSIDALINIHGFDTSLAGSHRYEASKAWIQEVVDALSLQAVHVATNLRKHAFFNSIGWEITHAAALASVAHALSDQFGRVLLASSDVPPPWGSNPALDPLWSSGSLALINDGPELSRLEKVKAIAWSPLVHRHLKVCWENGSDALNCGVCEKCVRTQAQFAAAGTLDRLRVFPKGDLAARINRVPFVEGPLRKQWEEIRRETPGVRLSSAIDLLFRRSDRREFRRQLSRILRHRPAPLSAG